MAMGQGAWPLLRIKHEEMCPGRAVGQDKVCNCFQPSGTSIYIKLLLKLVTRFRRKI